MKQTTMDLEEMEREPAEGGIVPIVKNWLNAHMFPKDLEQNNSQSLSIPDQSLTIAEMLDRQSKGLPISFNGGVPYFLGEEEMPDVDKMDLSEIQDLREFIYQKKQAAQEAAVEQRKKKDQALHDELQEFRKLKAEQAKAQPPQTTVTPEGGESRT